MFIPGGESTNANKDEQFQSVNVKACMAGRILAAKCGSWIIFAFEYMPRL